MNQNILQYESKVWSTADLLIGAGIKTSDFPKYMMPYFAMIMLESRLVRHYKELLKDFDVESIKDIDNIDDFLEEFKDYNIGYNDLVVKNQKTLAEICRNDKTFDNDFDAYLKAFDPDTKELLGVDRGNTEEKYLDISGISGQLRKKDILFDTVKKWSEIDLTPFNNSEITTLEEHIKRKWADISAETAGEQYTPDDIIALISEIILSKIKDTSEFLTIYDPTCGGGNLLFGVEDRIKEKYNRPTKTYGEDWSDSLYALAKIESRFRNDSDIRYGNTLTNISFIEKKFDIIVANPPYGVDWKGYQKDIKNDTTERFVALPSISDGQFLFTQHILHHLENNGLSVVVHNGATLFSDASSGEVTIRKHLFDNDWVEAIIQMPTDEFFNTGIYTYLWVFNKNKSVERKDKVILIDCSSKWELLKKSKGKKRRQMNVDNRAEIVKAFTDFQDNDFSKVFDKWHFYYNNQSIMLTNTDINGKAIEMPVKKNRSGDVVEVKSIKINPLKINYIDNSQIQQLEEFVITSFNNEVFENLKEYYDKVIKPSISKIDYIKSKIKVFTEKASYWFDSDKKTLVESIDNVDTEIGCGKINVKASYKKGTKTKKASIIITVELAKDFEKDSEIIPFNPIESINQQTIDSFMSKFITKPFEYLDRVVGVELNFNKIFYEPNSILSTNEVQSKLLDLKNQYLGIIDFVTDTKYSVNQDLVECDIDLISNMPKGWITSRMKDVGNIFSGLSGKSGSDFNQDDNPNNRGFIPFTNIAANTYILKDDLGTVIVKANESQNKVKQYDLFFLMSSEGYEDIGKSALLLENIEDDVYLNSFCKGFRITSKNLSPRYLNYLLLSHDFREKVILEGKGFTRINLKMSKINDLEIYYPKSIENQDKIADFIDSKIATIDECILNLKNQIDEISQLKSSIINDVANGKVIINK